MLAVGFWVVCIRSDVSVLFGFLVPRVDISRGNLDPRKASDLIGVKDGTVCLLAVEVVSVSAKGLTGQRSGRDAVDTTDARCRVIL